VIAYLVLLAVQQYSHGNPTNEDQYILEMVNRARANPAAEQDRIQKLYSSPTLPAGWTLTTGFAAPVPAIPPQPPLAFNAALIGSSRSHSLDMWNNNYFDHVSPTDPANTPQNRMVGAGYTLTGNWSLGENISTADPGSPTFLEDILMIDNGEVPPGHRINLLDIRSGPGTPFREIGMGFFDMGSSKSNIFRNVLTQDFARSDSSGPFIVGVVYWDHDNNGFYTPGEGLGGVKITVSGGTTFTAVTSSSGGFAIPYTGTGSVTVTATGTNIEGGSLTSGPVTLGAENVKVDFAITLAMMPDTSMNGLPDFWKALWGSNPNAVLNSNGFTNIQEFQGGADPSNAASTPAPLPPSGGAGGGGGGGAAVMGTSTSKSPGCGLTGWEGMLLLSVALGTRRRRPS
jgi:hypothetical protein